MKKQSCRMTPQEREVHKEAIKLRKMTDQQLIDYVNGLKEQAGTEKDQEAAHTGGKAAVECFLQELKEKTGSGNGIGNGTIFKLKRILDTMPDDFTKKEA